MSKRKVFYKNKHFLEDGNVLVFQRGDTKKPEYHCRIKIEGRKDYIFKSTKSVDLQKSIKFSRDLYQDLMYKVRNKLPISYETFRTVWKNFMKVHIVGLSNHRIDVYKSFSKKFDEFF